jgi:hypothetical protein
MCSDSSKPNSPSRPRRPVQYGRLSPELLLAALAVIGFLAVCYVLARSSESIFRWLAQRLETEEGSESNA